MNQLEKLKADISDNEKKIRKLIAKNNIGENIDEAITELSTDIIRLECAIVKGAKKKDNGALMRNAMS